ncbi:sigma-70 family RNA polymerase sigma factor [Litchfieldia salsa]|uniref:RNA polymerase sigma-70 factor, ECF subfamily n=1 Tax=Litchfieldia salsa TaxID=930152 RepID=A0A1H0X1W8_9BACI|nr:sigma-70 family RNA polymerase sigma factor [Litchfieldia salsa]SDP96466.1 RNA polymerase sigma-70 factor, ECF subfamily [Litchfieldia salsa]
MNKANGDEMVDIEIKDEWFERIMDVYGERLTKLCFNYTKDWSISEDIVQEVFITCYREYENIDKITFFKAWIYRITINKCKDLLKSSFFKRVVMSSNLIISSRTLELSPEMSIMKSSEEEFLSTCVLALPIKYREVITLYYYEELPIEDISRILKINNNTVKTRLNRARAKLKVLMERWR